MFHNTCSPVHLTFMEFAVLKLLIAIFTTMFPFLIVALLILKIKNVVVSYLRFHFKSLGIIITVICVEMIADFRETTMMVVGEYMMKEEDMVMEEYMLMVEEDMVLMDADTMMVEEDKVMLEEDMVEVELLLGTESLNSAFPRQHKTVTNNENVNSTPLLTK